MQKRTKIITASIVAGVLVLGATAAIAGPIVYRDLIVGEADAAPSVTAAPSADDWFSRVIGRPLRLVHLDDPRRRPVDPEVARPDDVVSFADGFPMLLATEESLAQLNAWIADGPRAGDGPLPMTRFRPNLIVSGADAFAEDGWRRIRVGTVAFRVLTPCIRCVLTTIDPDSAVRTKEPLVSLARHRRFGNKLLFAMNLVPEAPAEGMVPETAYGSIRVGDPVEVLETR
jgi:uncharacterized protein YcbX